MSTATLIAGNHPDVHIKPGDWRESVRDRMRSLQSQLEDYGSILPGDERAALTESVNRDLYTASLMADNSPNFLEWITGARTEGAWRALHAAELTLMRAAPDRKVIVLEIAQLAKLHAKGVLDDDHPAVLQLNTAAQTPEHLGQMRSAAIAVVAAAHARTDAQHRRLRDYRTTLRVLAGGMGALAVVCLAAVLLWPTQLGGLVPPVPGTGAGPALAVMFVGGVLGSLITAGLSLATMDPRTTSPYDTFKDQAALKIAFGSWCGYFGPVILGLGLAPEAQSTLTGSLMALVLVSVMFGAQQETVTRFFDREARKLVPTDG